jgi:hypothetical protein
MTFDVRPWLRRASFLLVATSIACKPALQEPARPADGGPRVRATVVTIQAVTEPEKKTFTRTIVIAGDRVRDTGELDVWRLYDTKAKTITWVDDVAKTIRTEPFASVLEKRRGAVATALPAYYPRATFTRTKERRTLQGVLAAQAVIEAGSYRRELWLGTHQAIPAELFAMMHLSEPPSTPLAPMMRAVDEAIATTRGFPLADRLSIPMRSGNLVVERTVTAIAQQEVLESVLTLPKAYRDVTPKPPPAAKKN